MQNKAEITTNLMERLDWRFARRDESRIARRLWKKQPVDAIYSLEEVRSWTNSCTSWTRSASSPVGRHCGVAGRDIDVPSSRVILPLDASRRLGADGGPGASYQHSETL